MADRPVNMATRYMYFIFSEDIITLWTVSDLVMGRRRGCGDGEEGMVWTFSSVIFPLLPITSFS